jgi:glutamate formiminotransferase
VITHHLEQVEQVVPAVAAILNINAIDSSMAACVPRAVVAALVCVAQVKVLGAVLPVNGSAEQNLTMKTVD